MLQLLPLPGVVDLNPKHCSPSPALRLSREAAPINADVPRSPSDPPPASTPPPATVARPGARGFLVPAPRTSPRGARSSSRADAALCSAGTDSIFSGEVTVDCTLSTGCFATFLVPGSSSIWIRAVASGCRGCTGSLLRSVVQGFRHPPAAPPRRLHRLAAASPFPGERPSNGSGEHRRAVRKRTGVLPPSGATITDGGVICGSGARRQFAQRPGVRIGRAPIGGRSRRRRPAPAGPPCRRRRPSCRPSCRSTIRPARLFRPRPPPPRAPALPRFVFGALLEQLLADVRSRRERRVDRHGDGEHRPAKALHARIGLAGQGQRDRVVGPRGNDQQLLLAGDRIEDEHGHRRRAGAGVGQRQGQRVVLE